VLEDPSRDEWQKPHDVVMALNLKNADVVNFFISIPPLLICTASKLRIGPGITDGPPGCHKPLLPETPSRGHESCPAISGTHVGAPLPSR